VRSRYFIALSRETRERRARIALREFIKDGKENRGGAAAEGTMTGSSREGDKEGDNRGARKTRYSILAARETHCGAHLRVSWTPRSLGSLSRFCESIFGEPISVRPLRETRSIITERTLAE